MGGYPFDLVANLFGGVDSALSRLVYALVGISAVVQAIVWARGLSMGSSDRRDGRTSTASQPR